MQYQKANKIRQLLEKVGLVTSQRVTDDSNLFSAIACIALSKSLREGWSSPFIPPQAAIQFRIHDSILLVVKTACIKPK